MAITAPHTNLSHFKTKLSGHGARANLFEVTLGIPSTTGVTITSGDTETTLTSLPTGYQFWVKAGQVPGSTVSMLPVNHGGRVLKVPGLRTFDDWTCTVINDENATIKKFMVQWMIEMSGAMTGNRSLLGGEGGAGEGHAGYKHEDMKIAQYSSSGGLDQTYTIHNAWPNAIADTPVDWGTDGLQEFTLTFSYDYFSHSETFSTTSYTLDLEGTTTTGPTI